MSPDIHWHVGDDVEQETIAQSTPARRSHRNWIAITIVVMLGVTLGVVYRSLPEPLPRSTPELSPTPAPVSTRPPIPAALYRTIDREAQALADGDSKAYLETRTQTTSEYSQEMQRQSFAAWGRPKDDRPVYVLVDFNLLTATSAWADIRQFREDRYFRETRFYYQEDDRWWHGSTNHTLWSGQEERIQTPHFDVTYAIEDRDVISPTLHQLEEDYQALCRDLGCASIGQELTFTLKMGGNVESYASPANLAEEIQLDSPRVLGFYESGRAYGWKNSDAYAALLQAIIVRVHGPAGYDRPGGGILWAASIWALNRIDPLPAATLNSLGDLQQKPFVSLETLWEIGWSDESGLALVQSYQLVHFIEQEYGAAAVTDLLVAIGSATSMSDAVENGLGVPFEEFDQKWQAWAAQYISNQ